MEQSQRYRPTYHTFVESLIRSGYANLKYLDRDILHDRFVFEAGCTIVQFGHDGKITESRTASKADFIPSPTGTQRRLFILQGECASLVNQIGEALDIEPEFFADHLRAVTWEHHNDKTNNHMLPSVRRGAHFWTLQYFEPVQLEGHFGLSRTQLRHGGLLRRMIIRNPDKDQPGSYSVGLVTRFMSFWHRRHDNGSFDAVLLIDPPLENPLEFKVDRSDKPYKTMSTSWRPYGGGYTNFAMLHKRKSLIKLSPSTDTSHSGCLKEDLIWKLRHASLFVTTEDNVERVSIILQKIALSNWLLSLAFLWRDFSSIHLEYLTDEDIPMDKVQFVLQDIDSSRSLLNRCILTTRRNLFQLGIKPSDENYYTSWHHKDADDQQLLVADWSFLFQELKSWAEDTERLVNTRMLNLQVFDAKRSQKVSELSQEMAWRSMLDSRQMNTLTRLGQVLLLVFTPAGMAYGILSMPGDFAPGRGRFWVFFAVAVPLCLITMTTAWLFIRATSPDIEISHGIPEKRYNRHRSDSLAKR
ncbi:uncharacterized protein FOBCDRAFT_280874 [Fusarium oxysporum Fo47]|uniref:Uncharacterized protein n=1 Tax=Fusarium oxysporum Fo47 TaxID=660027 RepID=W9JHP8_FUSOX|nr:uncharacterized protein FOBCDRAFT_280874 [Fusarium oxysporum Fo47]EWZ28963.1 hypothetical protein FOZG_17401 [Fusarium oxysporum Fo47]QKD61239.1 hypothetical protein FOBCDRAFT_280874 [Fusarium oxysporum Fo47]